MLVLNFIALRQRILVPDNVHEAFVSLKQVKIKDYDVCSVRPANYQVDWMISGQSLKFHVHRLLLLRHHHLAKLFISPSI